MRIELNVTIMEEKVNTAPGDSRFAEQETNKSRK